MSAASRNLPVFVRQLGDALHASRRDVELLNAFIASQDADAFAALIARHGQLVWNVCRRSLRDANDAEDAFQATFFILAREAGRVTCRESLSGWLYAVARRVSSNLRRSRMRRQEHERQATARQPGGEERPDTDLGAVLDEELARLPDRLRGPLILCYLQGKTHTEAAGELGCPLSTLSDRLARGCEILRGRLARRGLTLAAGHVALALATTRSAGASLPPGGERTTAEAAISFAAGHPTSTTAALLARGVLSGVGWARFACYGLLFVLAIGAAGAATLSPARVSSSHPDPSASPASSDKGVDPFGDPLPEGALTRIGTLRLRPGRYIGAPAIALTPDNRTIFSVDGRDHVSVWDLVTGRETGRIPGPRICVGIALSPDGRQLVAGGVNDVWAWDLGPGSHHPRWKRTPGGFGYWCIAFSPDGRTLACGHDNHGIHLLDAAAGSFRKSLPTAGCKLAFSPDGRTLAAWDRSSMVHLWDVATGTRQRVVVGGASPDVRVTSFAFADDGRTLVTAAQDRSIRLWDLTTGHERRLTDSASPSTYVAVAPDGRTLIAAGSERIRFWDLATGRECRPATTAPQLAASTFFDSCRLSPNGELFVSANATAIGVWEVRTGRAVGPTGVPAGAIGSVAFSPDGRRLAVTTAVGDGWESLLYNSLTGQKEGNLAPVRGGEFERVSQTKVGPVTLRPLVVSGGREVAPWPFMGFGADGVETGATRAGEATAGLPPEVEGRCLAPSPDGRWAAVGKLRNGVVLVDRSSGKAIWTSATRSEVTVLAFAADGNSLVGLEPVLRRVTVWDARTGDRKGAWEAEARASFSQTLPLAMSPDGARVALGCDVYDPRAGTARVWDATSGALLWEVTRPTNVACSVAFSPDGRVLATGSEDGEVRLWEVATGRERLQRTGHRSRISAVAFSPDGLRLATGSADGTALVWDVRPSDRVSVELNNNHEELWKGLTGEDAAAAYRAVVTLADSPETTVPLLRGRLRPPASGPVGQANAKPGVVRSPRERGIVRGVELLERMAGDPAARQLLEELAGGSAEGLLGREARAACRRIDKARPVSPRP